MIYLIILLIIILLAVVIFLYIYRKSYKSTETTTIDDDCCGAHAVCERDSLLANNGQVDYYDDEELDKLSGIPAQEMTAQDVASIEHVFFTLQEKDVAGWVRSLQVRNIELPESIRDEVLLVVSERRQTLS